VKRRGEERRKSEKRGKGLKGRKGKEARIFRRERCARRGSYKKQENIRKKHYGLRVHAMVLLSWCCPQFKMQLGTISPSTKKRQGKRKELYMYVMNTDLTSGSPLLPNSPAPPKAEMKGRRKLIILAIDGYHISLPQIFS